MKLSAIVAFSCIVLTILFSFLLALKVDWINGPEYWKWDYRGTGFLLEDHPLFLLSFLAFIPHLLAQYFYNKQQKKIRLALFLCSLSFFLQILVQSGIQENPFSLNRITNVIESPIMTGYYM